ncbi:MAG: hypothetical protein ACREB2_02445 [Pseudolabrys sp.]
MFKLEFIVFATFLRPLLMSIIIGVVFAFAYSILRCCQPLLRTIGINLAVILSYSIPISLVGYIIGYLTGDSRSPVVGSIVPSILTVIGGLSIYVFGTDNKYKTIIGYNVLVFVVMLFYGVTIGTNDRDGYRADRLINLSEQEQRVRTFRKNIGLPKEPPDWIVSGEPKSDD